MAKRLITRTQHGAITPSPAAGDLTRAIWSTGEEQRDSSVADLLAPNTGLDPVQLEDQGYLLAAAAFTVACSQPRGRGAVLLCACLTHEITWMPANASLYVVHAYSTPDNRMGFEIYPGPADTTRIAAFTMSGCKITYATFDPEEMVDC